MNHEAIIESLKSENARLRKHIISYRNFRDIPFLKHYAPLLDAKTPGQADLDRILDEVRCSGLGIDGENAYLINTPDGRNVTEHMLRLRFEEARKLAAEQAIEDQDSLLAQSIRGFQFRDIRPKAASEIEDLTHGSRLLGHSDKRITEMVYRRIGEVVSPTR